MTGRVSPQSAIKVGGSRYSGYVQVIVRLSVGQINLPIKYPSRAFARRGEPELSMQSGRVP